MAGMGAENLLKRLLGIEDLQVRDAHFTPQGVVVDVRARRGKARCGVCARPCPRYNTSPPGAGVIWPWGARLSGCATRRTE